MKVLAHLDVFVCIQLGAPVVVMVRNVYLYNFGLSGCQKTSSPAGMFLGGSGGGAPLVKVLARFGGLSPPKFLYLSCLSECIDRAPNVLHGIPMMNFLTATCPFRPLKMLATLRHN